MKMPDKNLTLALIDEVYSRKSLEPLYGLTEEYEHFREINGGIDSDSMGEIPQYNPEVETFILGLKIMEDDLADIVHLTLDGDREAYAIIFPHWWDMGDQFVINNLEGLHQCKNLVDLNLGQGLFKNASLKPLLSLKSLKKLSLCATGQYRDIETLTALNLNEISITNTSSSQPWGDVLSDLDAKGVRISRW